MMMKSILGEEIKNLTNDNYLKVTSTFFIQAFYLLQSSYNVSLINTFFLNISG